MPVNILDNLTKIKKLDSQNMLGSLQMLGNQVEQIYQEAQNLYLPVSYKTINNILVLGMGGSAIGAHVFKTVFSEELKVPVEIINNYNLPKFVNSKTLVIASSYSGSTEEVLVGIEQAKKLKAKIVCITAGGKLVSYAKKNKIPALVFSTKNNPSNQPRMGLGYSIVGQMILLNKIGLLKINSQEIKKVIKVLSYYDGVFGTFTPSLDNLAKQLALFTNDSSIWYVASEHLSGNVHVASNQMNENAKRFGGYFILPELNHHLLEGIKNPQANKNNLLFVFFESKLYHLRNQKRYEITKQVLDKNNIQYFTYECQEKDKISQACEVLVFGSYVSFYSAMLQGIDPSPVPWVDFFKEAISHKS